MRDNAIEERDSREPSEFKLRELRRIITRHRRRQEQAERSYRDWQRSWSVDERVREEQLARIGNQLRDRLQNRAPLSDVGDEVLEN